MKKYKISLPVSVWKDIKGSFLNQNKYAEAAVIRNATAFKEDSEFVDCPDHIFFNYNEKTNSIEILSDLNEKSMKDNILQWAANRDLLRPENQIKQLAKLTEETGELAAAILRGDKAKVADAIGDIQVVLIILSAQAELNYEKCLELAYQEIKDRKGKTENGIFIKQ